MRVLLAMNDGKALQRALQHHGFVVDLAVNLSDAESKAHCSHYSVIVVQPTIAKQDAGSLIKHWRQQGIQTYILALMSGAHVDDRVHALDSGADDCLAQPYQMEELAAHLRALIRRCHQKSNPILRV